MSAGVFVVLLQRATLSLASSRSRSRLAALLEPGPALLDDLVVCSVRIPIRSRLERGCVLTELQFSVKNEREQIARFLPVLGPLLIRHHLCEEMPPAADHLQ